MPGLGQCADRDTRRCTSRLRQTFLIEQAHLLDDVESALCFLFVDLADGETNVNEHVVAGLCFRNEVEVGLPRDAAKLHPPDAVARYFLSFDDLSGYRQTHGSLQRPVMQAGNLRRVGNPPLDLRRLPTGAQDAILHSSSNLKHDQPRLERRPRPLATARSRSSRCPARSPPQIPSPADLP